MDCVRFLRLRVWLFAAAVSVTTSTSLHSASSASAPPLPAPTGAVVNVSTVTQLQNAVNTAPPGMTIMIARGTYNLTSTLYLDVDDVTLRGATDNRNDVILVGKGMTNGNYGAVRFGVWTNAQRIMIANLTIRDVYEHHIMLNPGAESPRIYNVRLVDAGKQFIMANPENAGGGVDNGRVEYSTLEYSNTAPDSYTNGLEVLAGSGWAVSNNLFRNIRAPQGQLAGPAVLFWHGSRDAVIEGNTFINCQREIVLGLEAATPDDNTGGVVRNNFIYRTASMLADSAISVGDSPNTQVLHNTVFVNGTYSTPIEYRFPDTTGVVIRNNLLDGTISARDRASGTVTANYTSAAASMFVNPTAGDLHLKSTATAVIDRATVLSNASQDWDGESRPQGSAADFGADEAASATSPPNQALTVPLTSLTTGTDLVVEATTTLVAASLPSPWLATNVGSPAVGGSATYASGTFTIKGTGADIGGTADQFHFAYRTLTGNGEIVARIASLQDATRARAGVMIRETLTAASRHAFAGVTPSGLAFQRRITTGASSWGTLGGTGTMPHWVRLVRSGSTFSAYRSTTGTSWTLIGSETIPMAATVYVGLAVTSRSVSTLATATFTGATVTAGTSNALPSVSVTSPSSTATFNAPATINVTASASDSDGTIASVKFYAGSTLIGTDTSSPYSVTWSNVPAGSYILTAVAVDDDGASRTSAPVSIGVGTSITLPRLLIFTASANHATNVTSYRVDIFAAGANPSTATPVRTQNLGKPALVNGEITVDIAALVQALPTGSYFVTVTAIGPGGSARSSPSPTFAR